MRPPLMIHVVVVLWESREASPETDTSVNDNGVSPAALAPSSVATGCVDAVASAVFGVAHADNASSSEARTIVREEAAK